jgi:hypothetical protein
VSPSQPPTAGKKWRIFAKSFDGRLTTSVNREQKENKEFFDELVIDNWMHLEWQEGNTWWMRLGPHAFHIKVNPGGEPDISVDLNDFK